MRGLLLRPPLQLSPVLFILNEMHPFFTELIIGSGLATIAGGAWMKYRLDYNESVRAFYESYVPELADCTSNPLTI